MDKIYSRAKIKIPNGINRKKKKTIVIFIILLIAFSTIKITLDAISPIFDTLCENEAKSIATKISNEQATEVMKEHTYDELFSIEKDNNGNIAMIKSNVIPMNEIISDVAIKIQNEINNQGRENIQIALRKFYRS
ncbi:MAG: hypothetical protein ACLVA2_04830 [Clostridia bacterium]